MKTQQTPQQRGDIAAQLRARVKRSTDPLDWASAYADYYHQSYRAPGYEALKGGDACYHFQDTAHYVYWAASELVGASYGHFTPKAARPREALWYLSAGYGRRYVWAVEGLQDALMEAGVSARHLALFNSESQKFADTFERHLQAAGTVNSHGQNPQAVFDVIEMFANEMHRVCDWLDMTRQRGRSSLIRDTADDALHKLHTPPDDAPPTLRRRKKKQYWC